MHGYFVSIDTVALYGEIVHILAKIAHVNNILHITIAQHVSITVFFRANTAYDNIRTIVRSICPILIFSLTGKALTVVIVSGTCLFSRLYIFRKID